MGTIWKDILKPFLTNEIIVDWFAPVITGLVLLTIPVLVSKFINKIKNQKEIDKVNNRLVDAIRPYIIQKINVGLQSIIDIRLAILYENKDVREKDVYNIDQLKSKLVLEISETRYIQEEEKKEFLIFIEKLFTGDVKLRSSLIEQESQLRKKKIRKVELMIEAICFVAAVTTLILISQFVEDYQNSTLYGLSITTMLVIALIEYMGLYSDSARERYEDIFTGIRKMTYHVKKKDKK